MTKAGSLKCLSPDLNPGRALCRLCFLCLLCSAVTGDEPRLVAAGDKEPFLVVKS